MHHGVQIKDESLVSAVNLSSRYINDRFLPDKAIDLIDEAASLIRMQADSKPEEKRGREECHDAHAVNEVSHSRSSHRSHNCSGESDSQDEDE